MHGETEFSEDNVNSINDIITFLTLFVKFFEVFRVLVSEHGYKDALRQCLRAM